MPLPETETDCTLTDRERFERLDRLLDAAAAEYRRMRETRRAAEASNRAPNLPRTDDP